MGRVDARGGGRGEGDLGGRAGPPADLESKGEGDLGGNPGPGLNPREAGVEILASPSSLAKYFVRFGLAPIARRIIESMRLIVLEEILTASADTPCAFCRFARVRGEVRKRRALGRGGRGGGGPPGPFSDTGVAEPEAG